MFLRVGEGYLIGDGGCLMGDGGCHPLRGLEGPEFACAGSGTFCVLPEFWVRASVRAWLFPISADTSVVELAGAPTRVLLRGLEGAGCFAGGGGCSVLRVAAFLRGRPRGLRGGT